MIHDGDVFITKLERGFFGAFRVLKTGRINSIADELFLIALTNYVNTIKPDISDKRLVEILRQNRFSFGGQPYINIYGWSNRQVSFEKLGNIPLTKEEMKYKIRIGDGAHTEHGGGFPLAGVVQKIFGFEAFLEWRWEHEREQFLEEQEAIRKQREKSKSEKKIAMLRATAKLEAYRYTDEKSDKFWMVEQQGTALAVNYGKIGTIGKFQVKEYDDAVSCEKQFTKLVATKRKNGYQPYSEFNVNTRLYFDDEKIGFHPLTSHPKFRTQFTEDFYYNCYDEETPFGSDEGSDSLAEI